MEAKPEIQTVHIRPAGGLSLVNLRDLWLYRELIYFLTWRDIKVRYKQTLLGASWAVLQPFMTMVVFSIFFGQMAGMPSDGVPYPIFSYAGLLPWGLFSKALQDAGRSLVVNRQMITKVYFPRIILPLASTMAGLVDFVIAFVVLLGMMLFYRIAPTADIWTLPLFLLLALLTAFGAGLWLAALNVLYRDIAYVLPFLTQFWLFITPVIYPTNLVSEKWKFLYALNPMTGVVEGFRWALLGTRATPPTELLLPSLVTAALLVITGLIYFRRTERLFADMV